MKTMVMKFITAFLNFFIIAYYKPLYDDASCIPAGGCRDLLTTNLIIIFPLYASFGVMSSAVPLAKMKYDVYMERRALEKRLKTRVGNGESIRQIPKLSFIEEQAKMSTYSGESRASDFLALLLPLAFVPLFGAFAPSVVFLSLFAVLSQLRLSCWKLCHVYKRPVPIRADTIGVWNTALTAINYLAAFNNAGLLLTYTEALKFLSVKDKLLFFFVFQNLFLLFKAIFDYWVPDVSATTKRERKRQAVQRHRCFHQTNRQDFPITMHCGGTMAAQEALGRTPHLLPGDKAFVEPPSLGLSFASWLVR